MTDHILRCGKHGYRKLDFAVDAAMKVWETRGTPLRIYKCDRCERYHLTSTDSTRTDAKVEAIEQDKIELAKAQAEVLRLKEEHHKRQLQIEQAQRSRGADLRKARDEATRKAQAELARAHAAFRRYKGALSDAVRRNETTPYDVRVLARMPFLVAMGTDKMFNKAFARRMFHTGRWKLTLEATLAGDLRTYSTTFRTGS